jgi:hypothetical protein
MSSQLLIGGDKSIDGGAGAAAQVCNTYVCVYVCVYIYTYTRIHTYIHIYCNDS